MAKEMKKFQLLLVLVSIISISSCCLMVAAGLGVGGYFLVNKYGQLIYFADFWASSGSGSVRDFINKELSKFVNDPSLLPAKDSQDRYCFTGVVDFDKEPFGPVEGKYAIYSSKSAPLDYKLFLKEVASGDLVFDTFSLSGKIMVEDHKIEGTIVTQPQYILFNETSISESGAVAGGKVSVGDRDLDVSKYADLINRFSNMK